MGRMDTVAKKLAPNFDDVTLCKHVTAEENAFILNQFLSYTKKTHIILASNIVIVQIVISIASSPSGTGFYVNGKIWRMVIRKNITFVA